MYTSIVKDHDCLLLPQLELIVCKSNSMEVVQLFDEWTELYIGVSSFTHHWQQSSFGIECTDDSNRLVGSDLLQSFIGVNM